MQRELRRDHDDTVKKKLEEGKEEEQQQKSEINLLNYSAKDLEQSAQQT